MRVLLDTNILTRSFQSAHEHHELATASVSLLRKEGHSLFLVPQNFYEFWVVATRPLGENGLGKDVAWTKARIDDLKIAFSSLSDGPSVFSVWEDLVAQHHVTGKAAHDARLAAAALVHNLEAILTFNDRNFTRYPLRVLEPAEVARAG